MSGSRRSRKVAASSVYTSGTASTSDRYGDKERIFAADVATALRPFHALMKASEDEQARFLSALNDLYNLMLVPDCLHQLWAECQVEVDWMTYMTKRATEQFTTPKEAKRVVNFGVYEMLSFLEDEPLPEAVEDFHKRQLSSKDFVSIPITGKEGGHYSHIVCFQRNGVCVRAVHMDTYPIDDDERLNDDEAKDVFNNISKANLLGKPKKGKEHAELELPQDILRQKYSSSNCMFMVFLGRCLALELLHTTDSKEFCDAFFENFHRVTRHRSERARTELRIDIGRQYEAWRAYAGLKPLKSSTNKTPKMSLMSRVKRTLKGGGGASKPAVPTLSASSDDDGARSKGKSTKPSKQSASNKPSLKESVGSSKSKAKAKAKGSGKGKASASEGSSAKPSKKSSKPSKKESSKKDKDGSKKSKKGKKEAAQPFTPVPAAFTSVFTELSSDDASDDSGLVYSFERTRSASGSGSARSGSYSYGSASYSGGEVGYLRNAY